MRFTKVKWNDKVVLEWTTESGNDVAEHRLSSADKPEPLFRDALAALVPSAREILELPESYEEGMKVIGVSFTHEDSGRMGVVITSLKKLQGTPSPLVLNTPYLREPGDDAGPALGDKLLIQLEDLQAAARRFIEGRRAQGDLFEDQDGPSRLREKEPAGV